MKKAKNNSKNLTNSTKKTAMIFTINSKSNKSL